eukprot:1152015-Pelagomonas_calceolata.AAC.4
MPDLAPLERRLGCGLGFPAGIACCAAAMSDPAPLDRRPVCGSGSPAGIACFAAARGPPIWNPVVAARLQMEGHQAAPACPRQTASQGSCMFSY